MIKTTEELKSLRRQRGKKSKTREPEERRGQEDGGARGRAKQGKFMRIYVRTAQFPAVARVKKGCRQKGEGPCEERGAILIPCLFPRRAMAAEETERGDGNFLSSPPSGERRFRDQSANASRASSSGCRGEINTVSDAAVQRGQRCHFGVAFVPGNCYLMLNCYLT